MSNATAGAAPAPQPSVRQIAKPHWWAVTIRGILALAFGAFALLAPGVTMLSLVIVFAAYALGDGAFELLSAFGDRQRRLLLALDGVISVGAGIAAIVWPGMTVLVFVFIVALWSAASGALMIGAALIPHSHGRVILVIAGLISVIFAALLVAAPLAGAVVLTWWLAFYAIAFGAALLFYALRLATARPAK